jgi:acetyltransferase
MKRMFDPKSVAVITDNDNRESDARVVLSNLLSFGGPKVFWIGEVELPHAATEGKGKKAEKGGKLSIDGASLRASDLANVTCYPAIGSVPEKIDLAVIATSREAIPGVIHACGRAHIEGAIVVSETHGRAGEEWRKFEREIGQIGKSYGMKVLGPNRGGIIRPSSGLNASTFTVRPEAGKIAFITQSASLGSAVLDWAATNHIGFSMVVSLGSMVDLDFGDIIDFIGEDYRSRSIILYMESVGNARKFMSAARGFSRNKPIIVVKPRQFAESARVFLSHSGPTKGYDLAYDVAFRRAGVVRVQGISDLFDAAEVLQSKNLPKGPSLVVLTNVGSLGTMAGDVLIGLGGKLGDLTIESIEAMNDFMPPHWTKDNPVDLFVDATVERFEEAIKICLRDPLIDGVVVIYSASRAAEPTRLAEAIARISKDSYKPIIVSWMGTKEVEEGREVLRKSSVPTYKTPEEAIKTYLYMYRYERNLELLYETPAELPVNQSPPKNNLKAFVKRTIREGRSILTEAESKNFLTNYGIRTTTPALTSSVLAATDWADRLGYPVVLKVVSPQIMHRSDVGGMALVYDRSTIGQSFERIQSSVKEKLPDAVIQGVTVEKMIENIDYQLILGAKKDANFGSVIYFGTGGANIALFNDIAFGIPPLNQTLARLLMEETEVYRILRSPKSGRPVDLQEIERVIVSFSNLIVDFPELSEMAMNPIVVADGKAWSVNANAHLDIEPHDHPAQYPHLVITPYPTRYVSQWRLRGGKEVILRPIKPEDEPLEHELLASLSPEAMRARFFSVISDISHEMLVRYCNIDYDREMAIVAELTENDRKSIIGIGRIICDREFRNGEFAVLVHDAYQGQGLGYKLVDVIIGIAEEKGLERIYGDILSDNRRMLAVSRKLGFAIEQGDEDSTHVSLALR